MLYIYFWGWLHWPLSGTPLHCRRWWAEFTCWRRGGVVRHGGREPSAGAKHVIAGQHDICSDLFGDRPLHRCNETRIRHRSKWLTVDLHDRRGRYRWSSTVGMITNFNAHSVPETVYSYLLRNNSVKNKPILIIFVVRNSEKMTCFLCNCIIVHCTSRTSPRYLAKSKKCHFQQQIVFGIYMHLRNDTISKWRVE